MVEYAQKIADILSNLESQPMGLVIAELSWDDIQVMDTEVLSKIENLEHRHLLREGLVKRTTDIGQETSTAHEENMSVSGQRSLLLKKITRLTLHDLHDLSFRSQFIQKASQDELFFILRQLTKDEHDKELSLFLYEALEKRSPDWKVEYMTFRKTMLKDSTIQVVQWGHVIQKFKETNHELLVAAQVQPVPLKVKKTSNFQPILNFFNFIGRFFIYVVNLISRSFNTFFSLLSGFWKKTGDNQSPSIAISSPVVLSESEAETYEQMSVAGEQYVATSTGKSIFGDEKRKSEDRAASMQARFGITLASQVVAGSVGKRHGRIMSVAGSLVESEDDFSAIQQVVDALASKDKTNPFNANHVFASPGDDAIVTAMESQNMESILKNPNLLSSIGLSFSDEELQEIERYKRNTDRSRPLNHAIIHFAQSFGGYDKEQMEKGIFKEKKPVEVFKTENDLFINQLQALSKSVLKACSELEEGQALYLDTGLEGHAMKLAIKRVGGQFTISCYDPAGSIEYYAIGAPAKGFPNFAANAYSFSIPKERLISTQGLQYFSDLIRLHSFAGWAEVRLQPRFGGFHRKTIYDNYIRKFKAIADPNAPPQFTTLLQRPQNTENCFAKRAQSSQLYELGKPLYKKLRVAILLEQKRGLIEDICGKEGKEKEASWVGDDYLPMITATEPEFLSPNELHELSRQLCEIQTTPTIEYYALFFKNLFDAREKLQPKADKIAIQMIENKIEMHLNACYQYLLSRRENTGIPDIFSKEYIESASKGIPFDWSSGTLPIKKTPDNAMDPMALTKLSEFSAANACKHLIQMMNHQIMKLSVNERHIKDVSERLVPATDNEAKTATLQDLAEANIVSFVTGSSRTEHIKLELNLQGTRKEISNDTFFKLVCRDPSALIHPKVVQLLEYLRHSSEDIEQRFFDKVYPEQHRAFETVLATKIKNLGTLVIKTVLDLESRSKEMTMMLGQCADKLLLLKREIATEKQSLGTLKKSLKLKNSEALQVQIQKDISHLEELDRSIQREKNALLGTREVQSFSDETVSNGLKMLDKIIADNLDPRTARGIINGFVGAQAAFAKVEAAVEKAIKQVAIVDFETEVHKRAEELQEYRQKVLTECLQVNPEYRILEVLATGKMGSAKDQSRKMYESSSSEPSGYSKDSVMAKIQNISRSLRTDAYEAFERRLIIKTSNPAVMNQVIDILSDYSEIEAQAKTFIREPIPLEIKNQWVRELFGIWLKHENQELIAALQIKQDDEKLPAIQRAFQQFIERSTSLKLAAFLDAKYPVALSQEQIEAFGWNSTDAIDLEALHEKQVQMRDAIAAYYLAYKAKPQALDSQLQSTAEDGRGDVKPRGAEEAETSYHLTAEDLLRHDDLTHKPQVFSGCGVVFLSQGEREASDTSTIKFLKENKTPRCSSTSEKGCADYFQDVSQYLSQLKAHKRLENKKERILEFCHAAISTLFNLPYSSPEALLQDLQNTIIDGYRYLEDGSLEASFLYLENRERSQILSAFLKLTLTQVTHDSELRGHVTPECYSIMKQWEQLIIPTDPSLSQKISMLSPDGVEPPKNIDLLKEIDSALHGSPIGLEKLYEGQKGLQIALTIYGRELGVNPELRSLADRLEMRNGDALLPIQLINYYSDSKYLMSSDGINSTQGRQFFTRAVLDAYRHANAAEKVTLITFLQNLELRSEGEEHKLKIPHDVFRDDLLMRCGATDLNVLSTSIDAWIQRLTSEASQNKEDRLLGFAKEINNIALRIERILSDDKPDSASLNGLYSRFICAKLAYQLIVDQATEEVISNLYQNAEYKMEMALVQANINQFEAHLVDFASHLEVEGRSDQFKLIFNQYLSDRKFEGSVVSIAKLSSSRIPGFITLGHNKELDIVHGALYIGNSKQGIMPFYMKSHLSLQELEINTLPFNKSGGSYVYVENDEVKVSITELDDRNLVIQRRLKTLDGRDAMLQYLSSEHMETLPIALRNRVDAEHFFIDAKGAIHAYSQDFTPIFKLSLDRLGQWTGKLKDHHGDFISIHLDDGQESSTLVHRLCNLFPSDELISIDQKTLYIPSIHRYIVTEPGNDALFITESLAENATKRLVTETPHGAVYTEKVLLPTELSEVQASKQHIESLKQQRLSITKEGIDSKQSRQKISREIEDHQAKIRSILLPQYVKFTPDSRLIIERKALCLKLGEEMNSAYRRYIDSSPADRAMHVSHYEETKRAYLAQVKGLKKTVGETNHMISYSTIQDDFLKPDDFQSTLDIGLMGVHPRLFIEVLSQQALNSPLFAHEVENLRHIKKELAKKEPMTLDDRAVQCMLIGIEVQHHLLERELSLKGKISGWERDSFACLLGEFRGEIKRLHQAGGQTKTPYFSDIWREIQAEFPSDEELHQLLDPEKIKAVDVARKPLNINTKPTNMPIESLVASSLVQFSIHKDFESRIELSQKQFAERLHGLGDFQAQEDGFYYENFGLFHNDDLFKLFRVATDRLGVGQLSQENTQSLFDWLIAQGWIEPASGTDKFRLKSHPSAFFSASSVASFLSDMGLSPTDIDTVIERLEAFVYETAVNGGIYSLQPGALPELTEKISAACARHNIEVLQAQDKIESLLADASQKIPLSELNAAFLLNDYSRIMTFFPTETRIQVETALNNAMTRMLFYKTELDHLKDVQATLKRGNEGKAVSMLHVKRGYQLDKLLGDNTEGSELGRKMQRAFLLFESEFGHRCNGRQVDIFRGLLVDDDTNPDKIDAVQARMGFGKTSLLPLVALYKTGDKLVRFIVPKSALETNTTDMSVVLTKLLGTRIVQNDFARYSIENEDELKIGEESPRLLSLRDAKADLIKRLSLYKEVRDNRCVLVEGPHVRNSIECQAQVFLDLLLKVRDKPEQEKELMQCISLINEIRSITTVSVFDELDATQDSATTDVNYTSGLKVSIDSGEIHPLDLMTRAICSSENKSKDHLAELLLTTCGIAAEPKGKLMQYVTCLEIPHSGALVTPEHEQAIYLIRAILTDPAMLSLFTEKEPSTDFGVWFQNGPDGRILYDYSSLASDKDAGSHKPLLIAVPYSAANMPKPQGSRFDNPEVTAMGTLLYYLDKRTLIQSIPHLEYVINSIRHGLGEAPCVDSKGDLLPEFADLFHAIQELAEIEDPPLRNAAREAFFSKELSSPATQAIFRRMLARTIIQDQITVDAGIANSNRYEQGTVHDSVIGFSGTAGDTSFHFKHVRLDPAADGNMTLGIMGRANCQKTISLDTTPMADGSVDYTTTLIKQLSQSFTKMTRTLIDVGGLCKASNRFVAKALAVQLKPRSVIFYDDATNTKKLLTLKKDGSDSVVDLTEKMVEDSDLRGDYFTYYDQAHSRGADIKQMDGVQAILTLNFVTTNNDYKQAIMRMRKIIDPSSNQSFSVAVPDLVRKKMIEDLKFETTHELTGHDVAYWLRQKELRDNTQHASLMIKELGSVVKNAILQQQAAITHDMLDTSPQRIAIFRDCIEALNKISPLITPTISGLLQKYGQCYQDVEKKHFIDDLEAQFKIQMDSVFRIVDEARTNMGLLLVGDKNRLPYDEMKKRIIDNRAKRLKDSFKSPSAIGALAEVQSESDSATDTQTDAENATETETNSFAKVSREEISVVATLQKQDIAFEPVSIDFLTELASLRKACDVTHMQHLFTADDAISCSPSYSVVLDASKRPLPPVRYFLARVEGHPQIILINQDEADLFKKSGETQWSLYHLTLEEGSKLTPVVGKPIESLKGPLLKKLYFSSSRDTLRSTTMDDLESSCTGLYVREQLEPSLTIEAESDEENSVFHLEKWGFSGEKAETLPLQVVQTHELIEGGFEKRGVTMILGENGTCAEIFISSKLNERLLVALETGEKPIIKRVADDIRRTYTETAAEALQIRHQMNDLKKRKKGIHEKYDEIILGLKTQREAAIQKAKTDFKKEFSDNMKDYFDIRRLTSNFLENLIIFYSDPSKRVPPQRTGFTVGAKTYKSLELAIQDLFASQFKPMNRLTAEEIEKRIAKIVGDTTSVAKREYLKREPYNEKPGTFIEVFQAALNSCPLERLRYIDLKAGPESRTAAFIKLWGDPFKNVWTLHFGDLVREKDEAKLWQCFQDAVAECAGKRNFENLEQVIIKTVEQRYASDPYLTENPEFIDRLTTRLSYKLEVGDKDQYEAEIETEVADTVRRELRRYTRGLAVYNAPLALAVDKTLNEKLAVHDYKLPAILADLANSSSSPEPIRAAIIDVLHRQKLVASPSQQAKLTSDAIGFLEKYQAIYQQVLENYSPISHRAASLPGTDIKIPKKSHESISALDVTVLLLDQEIAVAESEKKSQLAEVDIELKDQRRTLKEKVVQIKELKLEKSAMNKMESGLMRLYPIFGKHHVILKEATPEAPETTEAVKAAKMLETAELFFEEHFDLKQMIRDKAQVSETLIFMPPEFYEVTKEMHEQVTHMHGLDKPEIRPHQSLVAAEATVREAARSILVRPHLFQATDKLERGESVSPPPIPVDDDAKVSYQARRKVGFFQQPVPSGQVVSRDKIHAPDAPVDKSKSG
ncbi:MAG: hypothetical protein NTW94_08610 [Legionellales bacterium]|nr:hypothetical protein [Legionellales bacterium]